MTTVTLTVARSELEAFHLEIRPVNGMSRPTYLQVASEAEGESIKADLQFSGISANLVRTLIEIAKEAKPAARAVSTQRKKQLRR